MKKLTLILLLSLIGVGGFSQTMKTYQYAERDTLQLYLDFYSPAQVHDSTICVVYVFGGGFIMGQRDGERQKALLAKALAQQTSVILLDEPTAFLDFHAKVSTLRLMLRLAHETNKTVFLSTHDVEMAIQLSDALWIVQDGKISTGTTASLTESGVLSRFFAAEGIAYDTTERVLKIS